MLKELTNDKSFSGQSRQSNKAWIDKLGDDKKNPEIFMTFHVQQLGVKTMGEKSRMEGSGLNIGTTSLVELCGVLRDSIIFKKAVLKW